MGNITKNSGMKSKHAASSQAPSSDVVRSRLAAFDWSAASVDLDAHGCAVIGPLLTADRCEELVASYETAGVFRSRVVMARHGFGKGEYQYFSYPLPKMVAELRAALYPALAEIANRWNEALGIETRYPKNHQTFLDHCHRAGQTKPTPLLLRYSSGKV